MSLTSLPELKQGWVSVTHQLILDAYGIVERSRAFVRKFLDARTPHQVISAHVHWNFNEVNTKTKLHWHTICTWLENIEWGHIVFWCSFFDHSNELITFWVDQADIKRREEYLYQVVIIYKLLNEWFNGQIPNEVIMADTLQPSQLAKLNDLWIVIEIRANSFNDDREVRLYKKST